MWTGRVHAAPFFHVVCYHAHSVSLGYNGNKNYNV